MRKITEQFAIDLGCAEESLRHDVFVVGGPAKEAFYYHRTPVLAIIYQGKLYFRANDESLVAEVKSQYEGKDNQWFFDVGNIKKLMAFLAERGYEINQWGLLMTPTKIADVVDEHFQLFFDEEINQFAGQAGFSECFMFDEQDPDRIGVAYVVDGKIVGMAGCNQNGRYTFEIGMNVQPEFRGQGIATKLIQKLTYEIMKYSDGQGIPVVGTQFSHTASINAFLRAGYEVSWTEMGIGEK